jgi:hypothetical protein
MKFVLVNGRTPRPQSFCALCCEPIGASYLREFTTRLSYCNPNCYFGRCKGAAPAFRAEGTSDARAATKPRSS